MDTKTALRHFEEKAEAYYAVISAIKAVAAAEKENARVRSERKANGGQTASEQAMAQAMPESDLTIADGIRTAFDNVGGGPLTTKQIAEHLTALRVPFNPKTLGSNMANMKDLKSVSRGVYKPKRRGKFFAE